MAYEIRQWPAAVRREIGGLPGPAEAAVLVLLIAMRARGPRPEEYQVKPLKKNLRGLVQVNMKINREQIRVLFSVYGNCIVVFHVFKKTSPQVELRGYELALKRKKTAEQITKGGADELPTLN